MKPTLLFLFLIICHHVHGQEFAPITPVIVDDPVKIADFPATWDLYGYCQTATHAFISLGSVWYERNSAQNGIWKRNDDIYFVNQLDDTTILIQTIQRDTLTQSTLSKLFKSNSSFAQRTQLSSITVFSANYARIHYFPISNKVIYEYINTNTARWKYSEDGGLTFFPMDNDLLVFFDLPICSNGKYFSFNHNRDSIIVSDTPNFASYTTVAFPDSSSLFDKHAHLTAFQDTVLLQYRHYVHYKKWTDTNWQVDSVMPKPYYPWSFNIAKHIDGKFYVSDFLGNLYVAPNIAGPYTNIDPNILQGNGFHIAIQAGQKAWLKYKSGFGIFISNDSGLTWQQTALDGLPRSGLDDLDAYQGQVFGTVGLTNWYLQPNEQMVPHFMPNGSLSDFNFKSTPHGIIKYALYQKDETHILKTSDLVHFDTCFSFPQGFMSNHIGQELNLFWDWQSTAYVIDNDDCKEIIAINTFDYLPNEVIYWSNDTLLAIVVQAPGAQEELGFSLDQGKHWLIRSLPTTSVDNLFTMLYQNDTLYGLDGRLGLHYSLDFGETWVLRFAEQVGLNKFYRYFQSRGLMFAHEDNINPLSGIHENVGLLVSRYLDCGWVRVKSAVSPELKNFVMQQNTAYLSYPDGLYRADSPNLVSAIYAPVKPVPPDGLVTWSILPNPTEDMFLIKTDDAALISSLVIRNTLGQEVKRIPVYRHEAMSTIELPQGAYMISLVFINGLADHKWLVKM